MKPKTLEQKRIEVFSKSFSKHGKSKTFKMIGAANVIEKEGINNFMKSIDSYTKETQKTPRAILKMKLDCAKLYILYLEGGFDGIFRRV
jgi:NAD-dependent DNA ligase